jgi:transposase InsO family protein
MAFKRADGICCADAVVGRHPDGPVRAPRANAIAERVVGTLRRECFDHVIVVNEAHLRALLADFLAYDPHRPHRALRLETPDSVARAAVGPIRRRAVLGRLHEVYERAA